MIEALAGELSMAIAELHLALRRHALRVSGREPLSDGQLAVLRAVERRPGVGVGGVAEATRTAHNTASTLVGMLTEAGLLERTRDPDNRRCVKLQLTDVARERLAQHRALRSGLLLTALRELDPGAQADLAAAVPHLQRLIEGVSLHEGAVPAR
jgi:DNA-binding MarR family transcriptional regulator